MTDRQEEKVMENEGNRNIRRVILTGFGAFLSILALVGLVQILSHEETEWEKIVDRFEPIWEARIEQGLMDEEIYDEYFDYLTHPADFDPRLYDRLGLETEKDRYLAIRQSCEFGNETTKKFCHYYNAITREKGRALTAKEGCTIGLIINETVNSLNSQIDQMISEDRLKQQC